MAKGEKYIGLRRYLQSSKEDTVKLSFIEIEQIIGDILPESAYIHAESWWANTDTSSQAMAWLGAGYETEYVTDTYKEKIIIFKERLK